MAELNLASWVSCTEVEGPGKRFALWVQGCLKRCLGCCNPEMLDIVPKHIVDGETAFRWIREAHEQHDIEGVTFVGGEPMLQAHGLAEIAVQCQSVGLSLVTFTGYTMEELERLQLPGTAELMVSTDILLAGPFMPERVEAERNWVGSTNKRFHFLTDRYPRSVEHDRRFRHGFELHITRDSQIGLNGWPVSMGMTELTREQ